ncbi:MAG: PAS domain S-box protein [Ignavibacteria bacterium]|nr:PAS domain S-box protein [Ignavibacteria bacterium]
MLRALILEDSPQDVEIIRELLIDAGFELDMDCTALEKEFVSLLRSNTYDVILADFKLPGFDGYAALQLTMEICPNIPFICVSGTIGEETAVDLLKQGAADYVLKDRLARLPAAIRRALDEEKKKDELRRAEEELRVALSKYKTVFDCFPLGITVSDEMGNIVETNTTAEKLLGIPQDEQTKRDIDSSEWRIVRPDGTTMPPDEYASVRALKQQCKVENVEMGIVKSGNLITWINVTAAPLPLEGHGVVITYNDITEQKKVEDSMKHLHKNLNELILVAHRELSNAKGIDSIMKIAREAVRKLINADGATFVLREGDFCYYADEDAISPLWKGSRFPMDMCISGWVMKNKIPAAVPDIYVDERIPIDAYERTFVKSLIMVPINSEEPIGAIGAYWSKPYKASDTEIQLIQTLADYAYFAIANINLIEEVRNNITKLEQEITEHKLAEEHLIASETRYRCLFESSKDGILILNVETGKIVDVNPFLIEMLGYSKEEFLEKEVWEIGFFKNIVANKEKFIELQQKEYVRYENLPLETSDGRKINVEFVSNVYSVNSHKVIQCNIRDITQRKQAEEALEYERSLLRTLIDNIPDSMYSKDLCCRKTLANIAEVHNMGAKSEAEVIGKNDFDFYPKEIAEGFFADDQSVLITGKPVLNREEFIFDEKEEKRWLLSSKLPLRNKDNQIIGLVGIGRDITERKNSEEKVQQLSLTVEQSPVSVVITNKKGEIEYVNEKFYELTGYTKEEVKGKNTSILKSGQHSKSFYEELWNTILSGKVWKGELLNKKKNGEIYWESESISPLVNNNGEITHFVAMKEDITEKMKMISELFEAKERAESANKLKDAFINNMSHEIRTPLNGILGMSGLIKENYSQYMVEEDEFLFTGIDSSAQRIIRTVDMILNYSRLQTGEFTVIPKEIDIFEICERVINQNKDDAEKKNLEFVFDNRCNETKIIGDEYSITQVVSNLIDNAVKYTQKGFVSVSLLNKSDNELILEIKDSGIGISDEYLEHLFEPYRQEDMGYGRSYEGNGLGLSLVKKFLDLNNAHISVASKKREGATFTVTFTKAMKNKEGIVIPEKIITKVEPADGTSNRLVLIVEDDFINQVTIKRFLQNGYNTLITASSDEVLTILKKNKVDIILMDISLQGSKNGLEITKELKASKAYKHIPIIAATAHALERDQIAALEAGCDDYLSKPFSKYQLLEKIEKCVRGGN